MTPAGRNCRSVIALLVLGSLLAAGVSSTVVDTQKQLQGLNGQIVGAKNHLKQLVDQENALKGQIAALDNQISAVNEKIQEETAHLELLGMEVDATRAQLAAKEEQLARQLVAMAERLRVMYKSGTVDSIQLVLSAANFNDLLNRILFFADLVRDDQRQVDQFRKQREEILAIKLDLEAKQREQQDVVNAIKAQQAQLETARSQRQTAEDQVSALASQVKRELDDMQAQRDQLQKELAALFTESRRAQSSGRFGWPIDGVITQGFGCTDLFFEPYDPSCPSRHFHSGLDLAADYGSPVYASDGGIVHNYAMRCSWNWNLLCGYGRYVIIVHAGGFDSLYGHLANWAIPDGTQVSKGTIIGYEGSTGASTGPHVHFEIDLAGMPVDPLAYLP